MLQVLLVFAPLLTPLASEKNLPPFDFTDAYYLANGIDPTTLIGRPNGTGTSVIDNRENGPDLNNVRLLEQTAAYDHSGHEIFFYVTGLPTLASFTNNAAGAQAFAIAEEYKVYEFPRATNAQYAVFPKRQDLIADLRNGYFSNDPLGAWQVNLVRFTTSATTTPAGQAALANLAGVNGVDLDGTPLIKTISQIESLQSQGFVTVETPPLGGSAFRWFFCPVIEDPRDGAIAPDAELTIVRQQNGAPLAAERSIFDLFHCLQATGDECTGGGFSGVVASVCAGTAATCPCSNAGALGAGCANSGGAGGRLSASGTARVSSSVFALNGSQMPNGPVVYLQGSSTTSASFGDGRLCVGGTIRRLGVRANSGTASTFPDSSANLATFGDVVAGDVVTYQAWYRDSASFCTSSTFNVTNALVVTWGM
ncbi:MAG: hypothetical protein SGI72_04670 [Planctomycetota bacterium]|nr:hypothetical protein [Planctomycetota bacterium]